MVKIPLLGGAYSARSVIAGAQRCVNLYTEKNRQDAKAPTTHYPTPGFVQLAQHVPKGHWRGMYLAKNNKLYGVCGSRFLVISDRWEVTQLGILKTAGQKKVSIVDNGFDILVVDGSPFGYVVNLDSHEFTTIGEDENFFGGTSVDYLDTFFVVAKPDSNIFYKSLSNSVEFDLLDLAAKTGRNDKLAGIKTSHREIWLIGRSTTEVWYNSGQALFPFQIVEGAFLETGCCAPDSIANHGNSLLWLSRDDKGQALVALSKGYHISRVSNRAIENEFSKFSKINDAVGLCYQFKGHLFYALTFPSADKTWVYDLIEEEWHEEVWSDFNGKEWRFRPSVVAFAYNRLVVGDRENGMLYFLDEENRIEIGSPIKRLRALPVISQEAIRINHPVLVLDMDVGNLAQENNSIRLRVSDTFGKSWNSPIVQDLGARGVFNTQVKFHRLGISRNRVYELCWTGAGTSALNDAYLTPDASDS